MGEQPARKPQDFFPMTGFDVRVSVEDDVVMLTLHQLRLTTVPPVKLCLVTTPEDAQQLGQLLLQQAALLRGAQTAP
ncbi:hypothetical protein, partial [Bacillus sp. SIMBA_005]|uniref:hypothetical protein n=1 Tax=Bacillus sp. SIMBA_005 TaxID=3085754 RepID=UPI00397C0030